MRTLTIRLPEALVTEIEHESRSRCISKSDVVRERLRLPDRAAGEGGSAGNLIRDILDTGWRAKITSKPLRFRSPKKQKLAEIIRAKKLHR